MYCRMLLEVALVPAVITIASYTFIAVVPCPSHVLESSSVEVNGDEKRRCVYMHCVISRVSNESVNLTGIMMYLT